MAQPVKSQSDVSPVVTWEVTRACRLNCVHCPVAAQQRRSPLELSTYEAYKTIDQIVSLRPEEFVLTGGDVLERVDLYQLIDYARRRGLKPTITLTVSSALTGAVIGKLKNNGAERIALALDSTAPERHDAMRGIPGNFSATLLALRWARTGELPVEVNTLITRRNAGDLATLAKLLGDLGVARWNLYFAVPVGHSKNIDMVTPEEADGILESIHDIAGHVKFPVRVLEAPQFRRVVFQKKAKATQESLDRYFASEADLLTSVVSAGGLASAMSSNAIFISHTGEVSASPFVPLTAGNVRYQPLGSVYRTSELFAALRDTSNLKGNCTRCEFRTVCGGSRARAFAVTGDLFASDPLCAYQPGTFTPAAAATHVHADA